MPDQPYRPPDCQRLRGIAGWTNEYARLLREAAPHLRDELPRIVQEFYAALAEAETVRELFPGGVAGAALRSALGRWLETLFSGIYDEAYASQRLAIGQRHVAVGLHPALAIAGFARLRRSLAEACSRRLPADVATATVPALHLLLDLDAALIQDAYHAEALSRRGADLRRQGEAALNAVRDQAPCLMLLLRLDSTIVDLNPLAEQLTGYPAAEAVGQSFLDLLVRDEHVRAELAGHLETAGNTPRPASFSAPLRCRGGSEKWVLWSARRIEDFDHLPAISLAGLPAAELEHAQRRALQSERLAAIGQAMTGLVHESRNALQRSQACLEMLQQDLADRPDALDLVARVQRAQDHLHRLFEEVRSYAAPLRLRREPCDLAQVWRDAWAHLELARSDRAAHLEERIEVAGATCLADRFALEQVFRNIFENSLAACGAAVRIVVCCRADELEGAAAITVAVQDNGPGLDAVQAARIFEPFFTTKTKGTGLGMAIACRIVEAHGGRISVGDPTGQGAQIVVTLPRVGP